MPSKRRTSAPRNATVVTAAATRVRLGDKARAKRDLGSRSPWQETAWSMFDVVPEAKQGVWFMGNGLAKIRLFVATMPPSGDEPAPADAEVSEGETPLVPADQAQLAVAELNRLRGPLGGQSEIIRESSMNMDVAGEFYIVGWSARDEVLDPISGEVKVPAMGEVWEVRSISEVVYSDTGTVVKDSPNDAGRPLDPDRDAIIRVWQRHPRWSALADSSMAGVLGVCEALVTLHHQLIADSRSRHNAGLLTMPNELTFGGNHPETEEGADPEADPLTDELHATFSDPVDNSDDPSAVAPTIIRGPGEYLKAEYVRWIDVGRRPAADLDRRIEAQVQRFARGMNMPVEATMGHQSTTYANANQVDQDLFDDYFQPRAELLCDALTVGFLRPQLLEAGLTDEEASKLFVWYDPSSLIRDPDRSDAADSALENGAISMPAYRAAKGFDEQDAPPEDEAPVRDVSELARMAQQLYLAVGVVITAEEARSMMNDAGAGLTGPAPEPAEEEAEPAPGDTAAVTASAGQRTGLGQVLTELDRDLRSRLLVLATATMARALERAGNRIRGNAAFRPQLRHVPAHLCAATLGQALVADAFTDEQLLAEAFAPMRAQFMAWGAQAQADALDAVHSVVAGFSTAERTALQLRQAADLDEAWQWLEQTLGNLARGRLYDPRIGLDEVGEVAEGLSVPPGLIREAIARAGGAAGITTQAGAGAWVTITEGGTQPVGGIGTGELVRGLLRDEGASVEGYRWVYGPAARMRPFEPHARLSGVTFQNFDDAVLANGSGWPPFSHYMPGDHAGCMCDFEPVIIAPDGTATADY